MAKGGADLGKSQAAGAEEGDRMEEGKAEVCGTLVGSVRVDQLEVNFYH